MHTRVPPLKTQGKKTRLVPWLMETAGNASRVIEPFCGSAVFSLNMDAEKTLLNDVNPHIASFYRALRDGDVTPDGVRDFLEKEGERLSRGGNAHYLEKRREFNERPGPMLYLFLNRACFNGLVRFNSRGEFNTPFCKRPERFSKAYITKIVNQCAEMAAFLKKGAKISSGDFEGAIANAPKGSLVYCDPPYIGVNSGYFTPWTDADQDRLFNACERSGARVMVSSWLSNGSRENGEAKRWKDAGFRILAKSHDWIVGPRTENRPKVVEAVFCNF